MSHLTLADLSYITREDLAARIKSHLGATASGTQNSSNSSSKASLPLPAYMAVIDVRDSDHMGGHIRGSTWVPSQELAFRTAELGEAAVGDDDDGGGQ
ncbi:Cdc25 phosphatase Ibp1 [Pleosporales sp. CAS-2024a]